MELIQNLIIPIDGILPGSVHLLEQVVESPWIRLPCTHHVAERYMDAAVKAKFGKKTESPYQTQYLAFKKWFAANAASLPATLTYDANNPPIPYDDPLLQQFKVDLLLLQQRLSKEGHLHLPRNDYVHLWEAVQVMLL